MKKLLVLLIIGVLIGCATSAKNAQVETYSDFTYEGDYNPDVFMEWDIGTINNEPLVQYWTKDGVNYIQAILDNPDVNSAVRIMVVVVVTDVQGGWSLISYGYNKNGIDYVYVLDIEENHYRLWRSRPSIDTIHKL